MQSHGATEKQKIENILTIVVPRCLPLEYHDKTSSLLETAEANKLKTLLINYEGLLVNSMAEI